MQNSQQVAYYQGSYLVLNSTLEIIKLIENERIETINNETPMSLGLVQ